MNVCIVKLKLQNLFTNNLAPHTKSNLKLLRYLQTLCVMTDSDQYLQQVRILKTIKE